ncbi:FAD-binding oxidoreductase [Mangrovicoccus sp. HB161399]|uniref:NAD(P)/FAD-dependent oxidoreductase n=1 Tax=Mangrovicoccus sp. HB161399 TaxID=2720392 RepID=UPI001551B5EA|nr:FAD-dependent oxidoreductase [Mangrovicoccus sp. HB161399]
MTFAATSLKDVTFFPFWLDNPDAPPVEPQLIGRTSADLVIVGGGFTGLWAAIQAKEADPGRDVVLIEAGKVAYGASGRPGGIVSTSIMHGLHNAARLFPEDIGELERLGQENMQGLLGTLDLFGIDAHNTWGGELTVAVGDDQVENVRAEYELHAEHGHDVEFLDRDQVQAQVNSPLYAAGCWNRKLSGTVHPARLVWGLKRAALELGVRLHEFTPMESLERVNGAMEIKTHDGLVRAPKVLLCTNAFAAGHRKIKQRVAGIRDRIIATEPLSGEQLARIGWNSRQGVYDTRTQLNYTRMTKDNRIIFGGRLTYYHDGTNNTDPAAERVVDPYLRLAEAFHETFPQLDDIRFSHAWSGPIALTTRMAVHFQEYHQGDVIWAGGYSGFGISTSRFGARVGLAKLDRADLPELKLDFATTMPNRILPEPFRWIGSKITLYALDTADEKGGWRRPWLKLVDAMGFPLS